LLPLDADIAKRVEKFRKPYPKKRAKQATSPTRVSAAV
jgi:hypothetical protein